MAGAGAGLQRADVLWRRALDRVVIRRRGHDQTTVLTGSGVALWEALAEPRSWAELVDRLAAEHGVDPSTVAAEVEPVVADLLARGVVVER